MFPHYLVTRNSLGFSLKASEVFNLTNLGGNSIFKKIKFVVTLSWEFIIIYVKQFSVYINYKSDVFVPCNIIDTQTNQYQ